MNFVVHPLAPSGWGHLTLTLGNWGSQGIHGAFILKLSVERCPCKEALYDNTGNNWTNSCSESRTSSHKTIILIEFQLYPNGATSQ